MRAPDLDLSSDGSTAGLKGRERGVAKGGVFCYKWTDNKSTVPNMSPSNLRLNCTEIA